MIKGTWDWNLRNIVKDQRLKVKGWSFIVGKIKSFGIKIRSFVERSKWIKKRKGYYNKGY